MNDEMQTPSTRPSDPRPTHRRLLPVLGGGVVVAAAVTAIVVTTAGSSSASDPAGAGAPVSDSAAAAARVPAVAATPSTSASAAPDAATIAAAFAAVSNGTRSAVVSVPGGYEGADLTGDTTIRLWTSADGTTWTQSGSSIYPPPLGSGTPASIKAAGLPAGAPHAVFVVDDQGSTGDGSGVDVAFSAGSVGFGAVKGAADGDLHPSGEGVAELGEVGTSYSADFRDGLLVTTECSNTVALAECGRAGTQIAKYWRWGGTSFVLDHRTGPAS